MRDDTMIERIGESAEFEDALVEILGPVACSTTGCKGTGQRVRIGRVVHRQPCGPCVSTFEERRAAEERSEAVARLLVKAGQTPRFEPWSFDTYPDDAAGKAAVAVAREWLAKFGRPGDVPNLLLFGPVGSGKTGLAWSIMREAVEQHLVSSRFVVFHELLDEMRAAMRTKQSLDHTSNLARVPLLVLDDLGAERPTPFACSELLGLVDLRWRRTLPTIFTSNYDPDELAERLGHEDKIIGERIVSRMADGAMQHRLGADDRRVSR